MADPSIKDLAYRGLAAALGGPVDLATMVMRPFGYRTPENRVIGGSEWIGQKMQDAGLVSSARSPVSEFIASLPIGAPTATAKLIGAGAAGLAGVTGLMASGLISGSRRSPPVKPSTGQQGAIVYHGSPYSFDRFDPTKIGSGEGAQAYGYGHYVAESPAVAKEYQSVLSNKANEILIDGKKIKPSNYEVTQTIARFADDPVALRANLSEYVKRSEGNPYADTNSAKQALAALNAGKSVTPASTGALYTIDLSDPAIARMLDWDKPLSEQYSIAERMKNALTGPGSPLSPVRRFEAKDWLTDPVRMRNLSPQSFADLKDPQIVEQLRQAGIPGIRYLDQGSRGAGQGTSNFVVFPGGEDYLQILQRNAEILGR